jgi:hypothetical protein
VLPSGSCSIDSLIAATEKNDERKKWLSGAMQGEAPAAAAVAGAHVATLAEKSIEGLHSRAGWSGGGGKLWIEGVHRGVVWLAEQVSRKVSVRVWSSGFVVGFRVWVAGHVWREGTGKISKSRAKHRKL